MSNQRYILGRIALASLVLPAFLAVSCQDSPTGGSGEEESLLSRLWNAKSGKRWMLWQIPLGNSNHLNVPNNGGPREGYKDNRVEYFLGTDGLAHAKAFADVGVIALLFGPGHSATSSFGNDIYTDGKSFTQSRGAAFFAAGGISLGVASDGGTTGGTTGGSTGGTVGGATGGTIGDSIGGIRISLPGRIQAEDYAAGGEGVAYHDLTAGNSGAKYRADNVDLESTTDAGGGYNVGWIDAGEWLAYNVSIAQSGNFNLILRMSSASAGTKTATVSVDGRPVAVFSTTDASGWQSWRSITAGRVKLSAGNHVVRISMPTGGINLNWLDVVPR